MTTTTAPAPIADRVRREGYAVGTTDGGEWLTIIGSAYESRLVFADRGEADARADALRARWAPSQADRIIVARVQRLGGLYNRIVVEDEVVEARCDSCGAYAGMGHAPDC